MDTAGWASGEKCSSAKNRRAPASSPASIANHACACRERSESGHLRSAAPAGPASAATADNKVQAIRRFITIPPNDSSRVRERGASRDKDGRGGPIVGRPCPESVPPPNLRGRTTLRNGLSPCPADFTSPPAPPPPT